MAITFPAVSTRSSSSFPASDLGAFDPRLLELLEALEGRGETGFPMDDVFERGSDELRELREALRVPGTGGAPIGNNLANMDTQTMLEMVLALLQKYQSEQNSRPAPRPVGNLSSTPSWSGSPQPASWGGSAPSVAPATSAAPVHGLQGNDEKTAQFINKYLAEQGSPAAEARAPSAGEMMVQAGKEHDVDPLVLLSIAGHETGFGKLGVGMQKMLGVSAYDSDPDNVNPQFDGLRNQIFAGAETFANLRERGGASANDSIPAQLQAANRAGWATDPNWHNGVNTWHQNISEEAAKLAPPDTGGVDTRGVDTSAIPNYAELAPELQEAAKQAVAMGLTVTSTTGGTHSPTSHHYTANSSDGRGHAIDVAGSPELMARFFNTWKNEPGVAELFYDPLGSVKNGVPGGAIGDHSDHVHLAL